MSCLGIHDESPGSYCSENKAFQGVFMQVFCNTPACRLKINELTALSFLQRYKV